MSILVNRLSGSSLLRNLDAAPVFWLPPESPIEAPRQALEGPEAAPAGVR